MPSKKKKKNVAVADAGGAVADAGGAVADAGGAVADAGGAVADAGDKARRLLRILDDFANFQTNTEIPSFGGNPREKKTAKEIAEKIKDIIQTYYYEIELNMVKRSTHNALLGVKGASKTELEAELATVKAEAEAEMKEKKAKEISIKDKTNIIRIEKEIRSITNSLKVSKKKTIWDEKEVLTNLLSQELDLKKKDLFSKRAISEEEKVEKIVNSIQQKDGSLDFSFLIDAVGKSIGGTVRKQILSMIQSVNVEGIKKVLNADGEGSESESMINRALRRIGAGEIDGATKTLEPVLKQKSIIDGMEEQREELNRRAEQAEAGEKAEREAEAKKKKKARAKANKKDKKDKKGEEDKKAQDILDKEAEDKARLASIADEEARKARVAELKEAREKQERHTELVQMAYTGIDELTISKLDEDERAIVRRIIEDKNKLEAQFGRGMTTEEYQAQIAQEGADFEARQARKKADADAQAKALQAPKVNERRAELFKKRFGIDEKNPDIEAIKEKIKGLVPLDASDINMLESIIKFDIQNAEEGEARELEILYQDLNAPPVRLKELIGQLAEGDRGRALDEITSGFIDDIGTGVADYDRIARATPRKVDRGGGRPIGIYDVGKKKKLLTGEAPYPSAGLLFDKQKKPLGIFPLDIGGMYPQKDDRLSNKSGGEFYGGVPVSIGGKQVNIYHQAGTLPNQSLTDYGDAFIGGRTVSGADRRTPRDFGAFTQLGITATLGATGLANVPTQRFDEDQNPLTRSPPSYRKGTIKSYPLTNEEMNIQQRGNRYSLVRSGRQATYQDINTY